MNFLPRYALHPATLTWLALCLIFALRTIDDEDVFTQIALGKEVLAQGHLLLREPFLYAYSSTHWYNPGWLWQISAAVIITFIGMIGLKLIHCALFSAALLLSVSSSTRAGNREQKYKGYLEALIICGLPILSSTSIRPQVVAFFLFALLYYLLKTKPYSFCRNVLIIILFFVWQNSHPSVLLAIPLICLANTKPGLFVCATKERLILFLACAIAYLTTPEGVTILTLATENYEISRSVLGITEWFGYFELPAHFLPAYGLALIVLGVSFVLTRSQHDIKDLILFLVFTTCTIYAVRFVVFWSLISLPMAWSAFRSLPFRTINSIWAETPHYLRSVTLCSGFALLSIGATQTPLLADKFPIHCTAALPQLPTGSVLFTDRRWSGYIHYLFGRTFQTNIDGRLYLQNAATWRTYFSLYHGKGSLSVLEETLTPAGMLLSPEKAPDLIGELYASATWSPVAYSSQCILFQKIESSQSAITKGNA